MLRQYTDGESGGQPCEVNGMERVIEASTAAVLLSCKKFGRAADAVAPPALLATGFQ